MGCLDGHERIDDRRVVVLLELPDDRKLYERERVAQQLCCLLELDRERLLSCSMGEAFVWRIYETVRGALDQIADSPWEQYGDLAKELADHLIAELTIDQVLEVLGALNWDRFEHKVNIDKASKAIPWLLRSRLRQKLASRFVKHFSTWGATLADLPRPTPAPRPSGRYRSDGHGLRRVG